MDERRIGRRVRIQGLTIDLVEPPPSRKRFGRPRGAVVHQADVVDVSVSGMLVVGPMADAFRAGAVLEVRLLGRQGKVRVRRVSLDEDSARVRYGMELIDIDEPLRELLNEVIGRALHPDGEPRWHELHDG